MRTDIEQGVAPDGEEGFVLALGADEARRQAWTCASVSALILVAMLASVLSGTA